MFNFITQLFGAPKYQDQYTVPTYSGVAETPSEQPLEMVRVRCRGVSMNGTQLFDVIYDEAVYRDDLLEEGLLNLNSTPYAFLIDALQGKTTLPFVELRGSDAATVVRVSDIASINITLIDQ